MIEGLPIFPVWAVDLGGSTLMVIFAFLSLYYAFKIARRDPENLLLSYLVVLAWVFSAFSIARGFGHIAKIVLVSLDRSSTWEAISPVSGGINTITFVIIAAITFYYHKVEKSFFLQRTYTQKILEAHDKLEKAFEEIKADQEKIIRLERHATANRMASLLAHETRNPILSIGGFVRILRRKWVNEAELGPKLDIILAETEKLERLVGGILKAGREIATEFHETDPEVILEDLCRAVEDKVRLSRVTLHRNLQSLKGKVVVDKEAIVMALKEILMNAIEASPPQGQVTVSVGQEDHWIVFSVRDEGSGIPLEIQDKMFDSLFSTKKLASGLGLSFAREMIETHNGRISFVTGEGEGTTFHIYLPVAEPQG